MSGKVAQSGMKSQLAMNASNVDGFRYVEPYVRYGARDYYTEPWELKNRNIPDYEFLYFTEGEGIFRIEEQKLEVRKNDLVLFKPGKMHSGESRKTPFGFWCIHFDLFAAGIPNTVGGRPGPQVDIIPQKPVKYNRIDLDFPEFLHVTDSSSTGLLFSKIVQEKNKQEKGSAKMTGALFIQMLLGLFRLCGESCLQHEYNGEIAIIIDYIRRHYNQKIYLSDISREVHLQPSYISALFKKHTGVTLSEYVTIYRIAEAKRMLLEGEGKISETAFETGFYDVHHFSRAFKKYEGVTPGEYRKMNFR